MKLWSTITVHTIPYHNRQAYFALLKIMLIMPLLEPLLFSFAHTYCIYLSWEWLFSFINIQWI